MVQTAIVLQGLENMACQPKQDGMTVFVLNFILAEPSGSVLQGPWTLCTVVNRSWDEISHV